MVAGSAVRFLGRYWHFSAEDAAVPAVCQIIGNLVVALCIALVLAKSPFEEQEDGRELVSFSVAALCLQGVSAALSLGFIWNGCKTRLLTHSNTTEILLYIRLGMFILQVGLGIAGIYFYEARWKDVEKLTSMAEISILVVIVLGWIDIGLQFCFGCCSFNLFGDIDRYEGQNSNDVAVEDCARCFRFAFCNCVRGSRRLDMNDEEFLRLAGMMQKLFVDTRGFVLTDIAAGMALLRAYQIADPNHLIEVIRKGSLQESMSAGHVDFEHKSDLWTRKDALDGFIKYSNYMVGVYGAGLYSMMSPFKSPCLCCSIDCDQCHVCNLCSSFSKEGSDFCGCGTIAFLRRTGCRHEQIVYANFEVVFGAVSFIVVADHLVGEVIISIRGTFSTADLATDLDAELLSLEEFGYPEGFVHGGVGQAAIRLKKRLENNDAWNELMTSCPDYKITVVGHSLGGGVAAVLTILFLNKYPQTTAYVYGTPPILDFRLATSEMVRKAVITVVHHNDIIPRLTLNGFLVLKSQIVYLLQEYLRFHERNPELPPPRKWDLLFSLSKKSALKNSTLQEFVRTPLIQEHMAEIVRKMEKFEKRLFLPGSLFYMRRTSHGRHSRMEFRHAFQEEFLEFKVSRRMMVDHFPQTYLARFKELEKRRW